MAKAQGRQLDLMSDKHFWIQKYFCLCFGFWVFFSPCSMVCNIIRLVWYASSCGLCLLGLIVKVGFMSALICAHMSACMSACMHVCIMCCSGVSLCIPPLAWSSLWKPSWLQTHRGLPASSSSSSCSRSLQLSAGSWVLQVKLCHLFFFSWTDYDKHIGNHCLVLSLLQCFHKWGKDITALTIPWWSESGRELGELGVFENHLQRGVFFFQSSLSQMAPAAIFLELAIIYTDYYFRQEKVNELVKGHICPHDLSYL